MSMTDPIADMLTRIRNAQTARHPEVIIPRSNIKLALVKLLEDEGFIDGFSEVDDQVQGKIKVFLKYGSDERGAIRGVLRVSKPSRRIYVGRDEVPRVRNGLGLAILTTSRGILTDSQARQAGVGGEVICHVW